MGDDEAQARAVDEAADGPPEIVHLAGGAIHHGAHVRQRCGWCGYVLVDEDLTRVAMQLPADGSAPGPFPTWPPGEFVAVFDTPGFRGGRVVKAELIDAETVRVPAGGCLLLPPELTLAVAAPA